MRPVLFTLIPDTLSVQVLVDTLEQVDADDTVVCTAVSCDGVVASVVSLRVDMVYPVRIEDLVDAAPR